MSRSHCRVIGVVLYDVDLSYHDLNALEERLVPDLQTIFSGRGATHLDFWGYGDALQFEFDLADYDEAALGDLSQALALTLPDRVSCRMTGIDRQMRRLTAFLVGAGETRRLSLDFDGFSSSPGLMVVD